MRRSAHLLIDAEFISNLGWGVSQLALPLAAVLLLDADVGTVALLLLIAGASTVLGKMLSDRLSVSTDARTMLLGGNLIRAALHCIPLVAVAGGFFSIGVLAAVAGLSGAAGAFVRPSVRVYLSQLSESDAELLEYTRLLTRSYVISGVLRPAARLILVGDPDQLASVEAGAVLADIVGDTTPGPRTAPFLAALDVVSLSHGSTPTEPTPAHRLRDGIAQLTTSHRFHASSAISALASAIRAGHTEDTLSILRAGDAGVDFVELDDTAPLSGEVLGIVQAEIESWAATLRAETMRGDHHAALQAMESHRLLCAHRRGPRGVQHWSALAKRWATSDTSSSGFPSLDAYHLGEPLLVTANNYEIGLFNGDAGIVAPPPDPRSTATQAWFDHGGQLVTVPLARLGAVQPAYAMTVHRTQGSQFGRVTVILPTASSNLATRETLYTAVTRAVHHVRVIGSIDAITAAVNTPITRATGLQARLTLDAS